MLVSKSSHVTEQGNTLTTQIYWETYGRNGRYKIQFFKNNDCFFEAVCMDPIDTFNNSDAPKFKPEQMELGEDFQRLFRSMKEYIKSKQDE